MSDIRLSRTHNLTPEQQEEALSALIEYLVNTLGATIEQSEGRLAFAGAGYKGQVSFDHLTVEGDLRLSMMMKPLKAVISREIGKVLDQYLGVT